MTLLTSSSFYALVCFVMGHFLQVCFPAIWILHPILPAKMGIGNTFAGGSTGFAVPLFIGALLELDYLDTFTQWKIVFALAAGIYLLGNFCYVVMISAEVQPWNFGPEDHNGISKTHYSKEAETVKGRRNLNVN